MNCVHGFVWKNLIVFLHRGEISTDGVTLKVQNRHLYDFTVHHFNVKKPRTLTERPTFSIRTSTVLLIEVPKVPNTVNIRTCLNDKLVNDYGVEFDTIQKHFKLVTDGATVMANVAGSSISRSAEEHGGTGMRCYVHVLNNVMKLAMVLCEKSSLLSRVN